MNDIKERLRELEARTAPDTNSAVTFTVYDREQCKGNPFYPWHMIRKQDISIKAVIEKILAHLGMELTYTRGIPDTVIVRERKPESKAE